MSNVSKANSYALNLPTIKHTKPWQMPQGIMMLAAVLEKAGNYEIHLLDANAERKKKNTEEIIRYATELKPDVIGMTLVTPLVKEAYRLAGGLKSSNAKLIAGGPHATILPEEPLFNGFDAVVVGEGESTIDEAVKAVLGSIPKEGVKGLAYIGEDGDSRINEPRKLIENFDDLPLPARHLVNQDDYGPIVREDIFSSRGCSGKCTFCAGHLFGKRFRFRSAENVLEEVFHLHNAKGITHFHFVDDAMSLNKKRFEEICQGLIDSRVKFNWSMMTRIDAVREEMLKLAARAGCWRIDYGVESGFPDTLKRIRKPHTVEMVKRIIPLTARMGIKPNVFFILGFPWEDEDALEVTRKLMAEISPYVEEFHPAIASILIPFPGTEVYEKYKDEYGFENWWLSDDRNFSAPSLETHPYCETVMFKNGAVLDANFFRYSAGVKRKIRSAFKFMYMHNFRTGNKMSHIKSRLLFSASERLADFSSSLEHKVFLSLAKARDVARG